MNARARLLAPALITAIVLSSFAPGVVSPAVGGRNFSADAKARHAELVARAKSVGHVPILIKLALDEQPSAKAFRSKHRAGLDPFSTALERHQRNIERAQQRFADKLGRFSGEIRGFKYVPYAAVVADEHVLEALQDMPEVESIQEDRPNFADLASSVPLIGGKAARDLGWTGAGQAVAILDTGVDTDHPMLVKNVIPETAACFSRTSAWWDNVKTPPTSLCNSSLPRCIDGSGNAIDYSACGVGAAEPCGPGCEHGTHVAGIAAGNGAQIGVAPEAGIVPVQVFVKYDYDGDGDLDLVAYDSDIIAGLEYVLDLSATYDIAAVNLSLGGSIMSTTASCDSNDGATKAIIDDLRAVGIATIVAATTTTKGDSNRGKHPTYEITVPGIVPGSVDEQ